MLEEKFYAILSDILQTPVNESTQISMQNCDKWSSLCHIDIIMSLEEEFNILFAEEDLAKLSSQEALLQKVKELAKA